LCDYSIKKKFLYNSYNICLNYTYLFRHYQTNVIKSVEVLKKKYSYLEQQPMAVITQLMVVPVELNLNRLWLHLTNNNYAKYISKKILKIFVRFNRQHKFILFIEQKVNNNCSNIFRVRIHLIDIHYPRMQSSRIVTINHRNVFVRHHHFFFPICPIQRNIRHIYFVFYIK